MSYDLDFLRSVDEALPARSEVLAWFRGRPNYQVDDATGEALYANDHTGVYFTFRAGDVTAPDDEAEDDDGRFAPTGLSFEINYCRSHVFGLEAAPELAAFVARFDLQVDDPQNDGMGRGGFSEEGFLRGWNAGNRFGYHVMFGRNEAGRPDAYVLPQAELRRVWDWNMRVPALQARFGEEIFVPRLMIAVVDGVPAPVVTWGDAMPIAMPPNDTFILVRQDLAPRRMLGLLRGRTDAVVASWSELGAWAKDAPVTEEGYRLLGDEATREAAVRFFASRVPREPNFGIIPMDQVYDAELAAAVQGHG